MSPDDKAPPKGALAEAVAIGDELRRLVVDLVEDEEGVLELEDSQKKWLADLDRRRTALGPRLALLTDRDALAVRVAMLEGALRAIADEDRRSRAAARRGRDPHRS